MGPPKPSYDEGLNPDDERFRRLLEAAPDAMVIVDRGGRILLVNSQSEKIFGYRREELLNQPVEVLIPESLRHKHPQHREAYQSAPYPRPMGSGLELSGRRKDGSTFPVEISLSPLQEQNGIVVMAAIRDVTERKQSEEALRQSQERLRSLVNEVRDYAIFMLDPTGIILSWNEGAQKIKGYTAEEITGKNFSVFYLSEDRELGKPAEGLRLAAAEGRWEEEGWRVRKDGTRFWADVVITALHDKDGKLLGFTKVTRDITEGKRAREAFLLEVTNALVSNLDVRQLLSAIALCINRVKPFDYATLALYDEETKMLRIHLLERSISADLNVLPEEEALVSLGNSPAGWAYTTRKPLVLKGHPGEKWPFEVAPEFAHLSLKSGCWIPLTGREGVIGTLNVFSRHPASFSDDDVNILTQIAGQVAIALGNAMAFRHISELKDQLTEQKQYLEDELRTEFNFDEIIGHSNSIRRVLKQVETVAPTDSTVLILGETGTGKELLARAVHNLSPRRDNTFVRVNCASIPAGLLESELFGHEKGAFTGAISARVGRMELAHQGTIFLDEVGDIPLELQPKLLRALQEKEFERLGSTRTITTDVRIVAATNRDLGKLVASGQFRSDLFYRLNVFPITVPPLRERRDDIPLLVQYFLTKFSQRMKKKIDIVPPEGMQALCRYSWPGNIRELEHVIERAVILSSGPVLKVPAFEPSAAEAVPSSTKTSALEDVEREHIVRVIREAKGKIGGPGGAAERLGMNRTTLNSRMQKLKISRKNF
ncbi:MAG TPA: sigma 54-interacting transcriptional regulator [Terriglobales bacterium]|nr:sigma 54-interacting transcriptional regulator [Terriglobales bacterium]